MDGGNPAETIGLIGLGLLGSALAKRLLDAGFKVTGYDIDEARRRETAAMGVTIAPHAKAAGETARRVILSLPHSGSVKEALFGPEGLLATEPEGLTILDTTTGDPAETEAIARAVEASGNRYADACVIGSSKVAAEGCAVICAGGDAAVIEECRDLFNLFCKQLFHLGPAGAGARAKLVANLSIGLHRLVLAEALLLAESMGLDMEQTLALLKSGAAYSRMMDAKGEKMIRRDYEPEARLAQHLKDVRLILESGKRQGVVLPLSRLHEALLALGAGEGLGGLDNSAVFEILRNQRFPESSP